MKNGAREGDFVTVVIDCPTDTWIEGTVERPPSDTGDTWCIIGKDGTVFNVQSFAYIRVESRKADVANSGITATAPGAGKEGT